MCVGAETLTLEGGRKELTLQPHHPSVSHLLLNTRREGGRKRESVTTGKRKERRATFDTHTEVLSYRHHRLNCRHSFLSDKHSAPHSLSNPPPLHFFILTPFPCHSPLLALLLLTPPLAPLRHTASLLLTFSPASLLLYLHSSFFTLTQALSCT